MTGDLKKKNQKSEYRFGLLKQVALLFLVSLLVTGIFSWLLTRQLSYKYVKQQIEEEGQGSDVPLSGFQALLRFGRRDPRASGGGPAPVCGDRLFLAPHPAE